MLYYNCINTHSTVKRGDIVVKLDYKSGKPLHEQISQGIKELVICGALSKDDQLPSVRDLSVELTVNPNTVQKAYKNLETEGIIYSIRGRGNFVAEAKSADSKTIEDLYSALLETARELAFYGEKKEEVERVLDKVFEEREGEK